MSSAQPKESPCPDCGEMVRVNSLRCWNCGGFMNPEMEKKFMAMQAKPAAPILSQVPDTELQSMDDEESEDDFELSVGQRNEPTKTDVGGLTAQSAEPPAAAEKTSKSAPPAHAEPQVAHSVATAGDALLDIARAEEKESQKRRKSRRVVGGMRTPGGGIIIFCPYGCRIEVKEQHRGMTGKCPKCRAPFIVPVDPPMFKKPSKEGEPGEVAPTAAAGGFQTWLKDLHLHVVSPEKLKIKADSLTKEFTPADFGFSPERLLIAIFSKKGGGGGLFARGGAKGVDPREQMLEHLKEGKPFEELPVGEKYIFSHAEMGQIKVVQPTASRSDSIFHGIPVFGEGRIAVQLPMTEAVKDPIYVSMGLTQFWAFAKAVEESFGITDLAKGAGIPPKHVFSTSKCHFLDTPIKSLEHIEFYKADPTVELVVAGYRCGTCGLTVSEDGRKKENLGGKSPKGIAKAKCPKCSQKMGEHLLYSLKEDVTEPSMSG